MHSGSEGRQFRGQVTTNGLELCLTIDTTSVFPDERRVFGLHALEFHEIEWKVRHGLRRGQQREVAFGRPEPFNRNIDVGYVCERLAVQYRPPLVNGRWSYRVCSMLAFLNFDASALMFRLGLNCLAPVETIQVAFRGMATINIEAFAEPGLYLQPPDGEWLALTRTEIERRMRAMLDDPAAIPAEVRAAMDYQPCEICPEKDSAEICHAIMTTLPFAPQIDRYVSYQDVTAVYREASSDDGSPGGLYVRVTSMQEALQYIAILSLLYYCEVGKKYYACFENVNPLMPTDALGRTVFANMYLQCGGDRTAMQELLTRMEEELLLTAKCQIKRLQLICRRDAFANAIVGTHTTTRLLKIELQALYARLDGTA